LELIVLAAIVYLILKYFFKSKRLSFSSKNTMPEIMVIHNNIKEKLHEKNIESPSCVYSTLQQDELVKSDGDLIPYNLTEKEKDTLKMFYNR
jgi:hypothetical protein